MDKKFELKTGLVDFEELLEIFAPAVDVQEICDWRDMDFFDNVVYMRFRNGYQMMFASKGKYTVLIDYRTPAEIKKDFIEDTFSEAFTSWDNFEIDPKAIEGCIYDTIPSEALEILQTVKEPKECRKCRESRRCVK